MTPDVRRPLARWLKGLHDRCQRISCRLEEAGFLLGDVDAELTAIRKQGARWAERIDPPAVAFEDADTEPILPSPGDRLRGR